MAQPAAAAPAPPVVVVMNGLSDLLPESYSGDDSLIDIEEFFGIFRQCYLITQRYYVYLIQVQM